MRVNIPGGIPAGSAGDVNTEAPCKPTVRRRMWPEVVGVFSRYQEKPIRTFTGSTGAFRTLRSGRRSGDGSDTDLSSGPQQSWRDTCRLRENAVFTLKGRPETSAKLQISPVAACPRQRTHI